VQGQQMAERVDGHMQFRAMFVLGAIVAGALAALRCRTRSPAVDDRRARLRRAARGKVQHGPQILLQGLESTRRLPALRLLIDGRPRW
jgi:hypothetical protein